MWLWIGYSLNVCNVPKDENLKGDILMTKSLHQKINKRILRLESTEIAPPAFIPNGDAQVRFDSGAFYESVYQYVNFHVRSMEMILSVATMVPRCVAFP